MNGFMYPLSSRLHFADQQFGHDADVMREHAPDIPSRQSAPDSSNRQNKYQILF